jgi:predicted hydrocarbon binding protein
MATVKIEIDRDIKMPVSRVVYDYPYEVMDIGDSFVVPLEARAKVLNANYRAGKRLGRAFEARSEESKVRVWRTR